MIDAPATFGIPVETDWIEVYDRERLLSIPCARMPRYTESLAAAGEVEWCTNLATLLALLATLLPGRRLVVAMGDSNTASARAWPRLLARLEPPGRPGGEPIVVNIANIGETAEQGLHRLASLLAHPAVAACEDVAVTYLGGAHNAALRRFHLEAFLEGGQTDFVLQSERALAKLPLGRRLARLVAELPDDDAGFPRWVARRAYEGVRALAEAASHAQRPFFAVLQPLCYDDFVPSYAERLRLTHAVEAPDRDFDGWRRDREKPFVLDIDEFFALPVRPALDAMRELWAADPDLDGVVFADWAPLFRDLDPTPHGAAWYQDSYDAIHYSDLGWRAIAACMNLLLEAKAPIMPPVFAG